MSERLIAQHLHRLRHRRWDCPGGILPTLPPAPPMPPVADYCPSESWAAPVPSTATIMPPARSKGHSRAWTVDPGSNRIIVCASALELDFAHILLADRNIAVVREQPPAVSYLVPDGRTRRHTFDFVATLRDGRRLAYAVKPSALVERSRVVETLALIRQQHPAYASAILLRTEQHITRDRAETARRILQARRLRSQTDIDAMMPFVTALEFGRDWRLEDLVEHAGWGGRGRTALVCLLDEGALELASPSLAGPGAAVRRRATTPVAAIQAGRA